MMRKVAAAWIVLALGCGAEGSGTGGRSVRFSVALAAADQSLAFDTTTGWHVELDTAVIAIGPLYLWEKNGSTALARDPKPELDLLGWASELVVPTAHAHPGDVHFVGGQLRGEFLEQIAFDLTGPSPLRVGDARGIAGSVRSVSVILDPPSSTTGGDPSALEGAHARVIGTASQGEAVVPFEGSLAISAEGIQRQVDGVAADFDVEDDGLLVLGVDASAWFDQAHFDLLEDDNAAGDRKLIGEHTQVGNAWHIGARSARAFSVAWIDGGGESEGP